MGINAVGQGQTVTSAVAAALSHLLCPAEVVRKQQPVKKIQAIISQKAKDLAAFKAGKSASEEADIESMLRKL